MQSRRIFEISTFEFVFKRIVLGRKKYCSNIRGGIIPHELNFPKAAGIISSALVNYSVTVVHVRSRCHAVVKTFVVYKFRAQP